MRRLVPFLLVLATALAASAVHAAPAVPLPGTVFVLAGGGWGHGVGMSQWGAYGQAKAGRDYRAILAHYYTGTTLETPPGLAARRLRVLVADRQATATISSTSSFVVRDGSSTTYELPAGSVAVGPSLELPVGENHAPVKLVGPLLFRSGASGVLTTGRTGYRGDLRVAVVAKRLQLVNVVGLETYLLGVVPGEMPTDWPLEALKAQAVAARTYALARVVEGRPYDLTSDSRSQLYHGVANEGTGATRAVRATKGEILTFAGAPIQAVYSSSSGGRTASAVDVYGNDIPYLQSVDDPWDAASPNHRWAPRTFTAAALADAFGLPTPVADARIVSGTVGRPAELRLTTTAGGTFGWRLSDVRARLGLKSSSFRLGTLRLVAAVSTKPGVRVVTGVIRDVDGAVLERLGPAGTWAPVTAKLALDADGVFTITLRPATTTTYRLAAPGLVGPSLTVRAGKAA